MASPKALFSLLVVLFFITVQGTAEPCNISSITASIRKNGSVVGGLPQWDVVISNACISCSQSNVKMMCIGYDKVTGLDPAIFKVEGHQCIVNNNNPILHDEPVKFTIGDQYPPYVPYPISSVIRCL